MREVTSSDVRKFSELFCEHRDTTRYLLKRDSEWTSITSSWNDSLLWSHLIGRITVGLYPAVEYDLAILDLDCKDDIGHSTLRTRSESVLSAIDGEPLIYTSSESGGLRICYFLDRPYHRKDVYCYMVKLLQEHGLEVKDGVLEVMAGRKGDRLPFGKGSFIVDTQTLEPIYDISLSCMLEQAAEVKRRARLSIQNELPHQRLRISSKSEFGESAEFLESYGLTPSISTNEALLILNRKYMGVLGESSDDAARRLKAWIRVHHNGESKRINSGRFSDVDHQIDRITESFDVTKYSTEHITSIRLPEKLTVSDFVKLRRIFEDESLAKAAFSLLRWVKNRGNLVRAHKCRPSDGTGEAVGKECLIRNNYVAHNGEEWSCEIPKEAMRQFEGFKKRNPSETMEKLTSAGLVSLTREYSTSTHRCRTYSVFFEFSWEPPYVASFDEAMQLIASEKISERALA